MIVLDELMDGRIVFHWDRASSAERENHILKIVNRRLKGDIKFTTYQEYCNWINRWIGQQKNRSITHNDS